MTNIILLMIAGLFVGIIFSIVWIWLMARKGRKLREKRNKAYEDLLQTFKDMGPPSPTYEPSQELKDYSKKLKRQLFGE